MIPFEYRTPKSLKEVHATLKEFGGDAKLLAGGTALGDHDETALGPAHLPGQPELGARLERHRNKRRRLVDRRAGLP